MSSISQDDDEDVSRAEGDDEFLEISVTSPHKVNWFYIYLSTTKISGPILWRTYYTTGWRGHVVLHGLQDQH